MDQIKKIIAADNKLYETLLVSEMILIIFIMFNKLNSQENNESILLEKFLFIFTIKITTIFKYYKINTSKHHYVNVPIII